MPPIKKRPAAAPAAAKPQEAAQTASTPTTASQPEYAPELIMLMKSLLPKKPPEDPLHPNTDTSNPLDKLSPTALLKLKAQALDAMSDQLLTRNPSFELQTICNKVLDSHMDKDNVIALKCYDAQGRKYDQRFLKVFFPRKIHRQLKDRGNKSGKTPKSIERKAKTMITVMELLSFDEVEKREVLAQFAEETGLQWASPRKKKQRKQQANTKPTTLPVAPPPGHSYQPPPLLVTRPLKPAPTAAAAAASVKQATATIPPPTAAMPQAVTAAAAAAVVAGMKQQQQPTTKPSPASPKGLALLAKMSASTP